MGLFGIVRFYQPLCYSYALRGRNRFVSRFYRHSLFGRPSGGDIFLCVKKDIEERHAKGLQSRPLESCFYTGVRRGDVPTLYVFALVQLTRFRPARRRAGGVRFTRLRRKAKHHLFSAISLPKALLPPDSIVLLQLRRIRWHFKNNQPNL